ncbi:hypothetical protein K431DRAFT_19545 [Polychaeton citri CBS 116435]|uniref:Uncharacterized protein n=1 Tax=Polychaeton citri CBS 116435 TaxID=1314669 RepID=A0A9P4UKY5_9PEZI|nr:hypothetical protein K431DRAFT_19545 [Polychaeton citri CBS 116435]
MSGSSQMPEVARVEDYDSDESDVRPGTAVEAKRAARPRQPAQRRAVHADAASDSGYSSHSGGLQRIAVAPPPRRRESQRSPTKSSRPVIHKLDSHQSSRPASRSVSKAKCTDHDCRDPKCVGSSNAERRFTMPEQDRAKYAQQMLQKQQNAPPAYQTTARPIPAPITTLTSQPRPRGLSGSQNVRPASFHSGMAPYSAQYAYANAQYGTTPPFNRTPQYQTPPSPSQYQTPYYSQQYQQSQAYQQYGGQQYGGIYGSTPPNSGSMSHYMANVTSTPLKPSPPSPILNSRPSMPHTISARAAPMPYDMPPPQRTVSNANHQQSSARTLSKYMIPGAYQDSTSASSGSETGSSSESSESESEDDRERARQDRERKLRALKDLKDRQDMPPPPTRRPSNRERRPSIKDRHTTPVLTSRGEREPLRRAPNSDPSLEYPSDQVDSDRTSRAVVGRTNRDRSSTYSSSRSRRPSVSTTASSQRTKATTLSSGSGSRDGAMVIIEDSKGRRRAYLSKEQEEELLRQYQQQRLEESVEAYQNAVRGSTMPADLTAENIKKQTRRASINGSHNGSVVSKHSHRSSHSNQISNSDSQSIQIRSGETVLHISGGASIEVRPGEDGGPASFVIASGNGREDKYHGSSRSSGGSRLGRSQTGSQLGRRKTILEEDGYEPAI